MQKRVLVLSMALSIALFSGCGGSNGEPNKEKDSNKPDTNKVTISGKAVDGYLSGSVVWLDLNNNTKLDSGEPNTTTDSSGTYKLEVEDKNYGNVKVVVAGGKDVDTGAMFDGRLEAPFEGKPQKNEIVNITPISTLVTKLVDEGESLDDAKEKVKTSLGVDQNIDILDDPKKLEQSGDSGLIAATLSLQKSIEMIAQAASGDDDKKASALQQKLFEAFAQVLKEDAGDIDGVDKILEKTKKKKIDGVDDTHIDEAKDLTTKLEKAIKDDGKKSGEVEKIVEIIKDDKQKSFDTLIKEDKNSLEKSFLLHTLKKLHIQGDLSALADDLIGAGIKDKDLKNPTKATLNKLKSDEKFKAIYSALKNEQKEMEDKKDEITSDAKDKYIPYKVGDTIYDFKVENHHNGLDAEYQTHTLNSDHTVTGKEYDFEDGDWQLDEDDNDYVLTKDGWKKENSSDSYKINSDGSITINDSFKVAILKQRDISGEYEYINDGFSKTLNMPTGSVEYTNLYESIKEQYRLWDKKRTHGNVEGKEFYTSIGEFIENQCGDRWFSGNYNGGVAFAGEKDSSGNYTCNPNAKSGKLFEVQRTQQGSKIVSQDGGSWEIKTVNNQDILIINPKKDYGHGDGLDIYAVIDGTLYKGEAEKAGKKEIWHSYNKTALDALVSAVKSGGFLNGGSEIVPGTGQQDKQDDKNNQITDKTPLGKGDATATQKNRDYLSGKTFYYAYNDDGYVALEKATYNQNRVSWEEIKRSDDRSLIKTKSGDYTIENGILSATYGDNHEGYSYEPKTVYQNGIYGLYKDREGQNMQFLFNNRADAEAYYNKLVGELKKDDKNNQILTNNKFTKEWLNGKKLYFVAYDDFGDEDLGLRWDMAKMSFSDKTMSWQEYNTGDTNKHVFNYDISDGKLVIQEEHIGTIIIREQKSDYLKVCQDSDCNVYLFFDENKAKNFLTINNKVDELKNIVAGKTLYEVDSRSSYTSINEVKFDQAMTKITLKEVVGDDIGKGETVDITYADGIIHFSDGGTTKLKTKTADYIDLADSDGETTRLYLSLDKAKEYMNSLGGSEQNSSDNELKLALSGQLFYTVLETDPTINKIDFTDDLISKTTFTDSGFTMPGQSEYRLIENVKDDHLKFEIQDTPVKIITFFVNSKDAEAYSQHIEEMSGAGGGENPKQQGSDLAITQSMLDGKVFYYTYIEGDTVDYKKMTLSGGTIYNSRVSVKNDEEGEVKTSTNSYTIVNGEIKTDNNGEPMYLKLKSSNSDQWVIYAHGTDINDGREIVMYLSKPANFPAKL